MALPVDILEKIKDLDRRLASLERSPQPPNISLSDLASASFTVDPVNGGNFVVHLTLTLEDTNAKRLLAVPAFSLYKNSVTTANQWPDGSNWTEQDEYDLIVRSWVDWGSSDNNNVILKILIFNQGASTFNMLFRANHRFLLMEAVTS